jgi:hypothetical protein
MGNSGPFRGELGEATEGSIRTAAIIRSVWSTPSMGRSVGILPPTMCAKKPGETAFGHTYEELRDHGEIEADTSKD